MERILIIEDEKDVNQLLAQNLQNNGYETVSVWDGLDGVRQLRNQHFDMVLLDLMLPYKSGDEILKEIRKDCDIPAIVISAKDLVGTKIDLLTLGADDYITKPFDLGEVTARVISNLRRYHMKDQKKQLSYKELTLDTESKTLTKTISISMGIEPCQSASAARKDLRLNWKKRRRKDDTDADDRRAWIPDTGQHSIIRHGKPQRIGNSGQTHRFPD